MFESAEIGHSIGRKLYKEQAPQLRSALLEAQYALRAQGKTSVIILVNGVDGAGKGETVNLLNAWMDPRHIRTEVFSGDDPEAHGRPPMWRFWQVLPPKGHIAILFGSWYTDPILAQVLGREKRSQFALHLERIRQFERMLVAEGAVIVKCWFHLSKAASKARLKALAADPSTAWRVGPQDWDHLENYDAFVKVCEKALRKTSTAEAPWLVVEGSDPAYRSLTVGQHILDALQLRLGGQSQPAALVPPAPKPPLDGKGLLQTFDYARALKPKEFEKRLEALQGRLNLLSRDPRMATRSLVIVFEGMDAAGKGSTIRRITAALDARHFRVVPVAAPTEEERAQPYLWRFWRHFPAAGKTVMFDRSWYGRVLVERVEGFCTEADWMRAYDEINAMEEELVQDGAIVVKFWMAITPDEQLRRFKERETVAYKNFKITPDDWRNREKWPLYEHAVHDMLDRTSTDVAPWHVVASNDKLFSRIAALTHLCDRLQQALERPA